MKLATPRGRSIGANADLFLVGTGVSFPLHLTAQTVEVLTDCNRIFTNLQESRLAELPRRIRSKCESLWSLYREKRDRSANYHDVATAVLGAVERRHPIAWLTPGHPIVFDSVSQTLLRAGRARGWRVAVVPGISCIDTVLAELGYDPAGGLLIHEATSFVRRRRAVPPGVAAVLLQPSAFDCGVAHLSSDWRPDLAPLRDYLLQFYALRHECAFVRSSARRGSRSVVFWTRVGALNDVPNYALAGSTLFLPANRGERRSNAGSLSRRPNVRRNRVEP